jgi:SAM-dependent methyltransferase
MSANLPARNRTVSDLIEEYEEKVESAPAAIKSVQDAWHSLELAAKVQGKYGGGISRHQPNVSERDVLSSLLKSAWRAIYDRCQIDQIASADDKRLFERTFENPPELTYDNAKATFGDYLMRPRFHILRGLAEVFAQLDPAYKSHSNVKVGVKGLPKRVIVASVGGYGSYGRDKIRDIINSLAAYRGEPLMSNAELHCLDKLSSFMGQQAGEIVFDGSHHVTKDEDGQEVRAPNRGVTVRKFLNGNGHVFFDKWALLDINRALAEFYGDVLPDAEEENAKPQASTAVAKDLQFYWSPKKVIEAALDAVGIYELRRGDDRRSQLRVLEPSCGDGRILDELRARGCTAFGMELHPGRAAEARAKGHSVLTGNFLEQPARPEFDYVVMNPPFYGRHYVKHVRHALKFLKPGGALVSILPATAHYDHKELDGRWSDLPQGSFSEAGTNVPTGILLIRAQATRAAA